MKKTSLLKRGTFLTKTGEEYNHEQKYCGMRPVARQRQQDKHIYNRQPLLSNSFANKYVSTATIEYNRAMVFSVRSLPRYYKRTVSEVRSAELSEVSELVR
jgi:hypothetical protein